MDVDSEGALASPILWKLFGKYAKLKIHFRSQIIRVRSYGYCAQPDIFSVLTASQSAINIYPNDVHCLDKSNARRNGQVRKSSSTDPDNGAAWDRDGTNCIILS